MSILILIQIATAVVFATASIGKWMNLRWFAGVVASYRLVPRAFTGIVALIIAAAESVLAILLLTGVGQPRTGLAAFSLLAIMTLAVTINLAKGRSHLDCGCSGPRAAHKVSWAGVLRNVGLMGFALITAAPRDWGASTNGVGFALVCLALVVYPVISKRFAPLPSGTVKT